MVCRVDRRSGRGKPPLGAYQKTVEPRPGFCGYCGARRCRSGAIPCDFPVLEGSRESIGLDGFLEEVEDVQPSLGKAGRPAGLESEQRLTLEAFG